MKKVCQLYVKYQINFKKQILHLRFVSNVWSEWKFSRGSLKEEENDH